MEALPLQEIADIKPFVIIKQINPKLNEINVLAVFFDKNKVLFNGRSRKTKTNQWF